MGYNMCNAPSSHCNVIHKLHGNASKDHNFSIIFELHYSRRKIARLKTMFKVEYYGA